MKDATLIRAVIKNFRSFVAEEYVFPQTIGLKMLTGENRVEPRLGPNGAGKSSFWEAIVWCLFGTGIKSARISTILTWGTDETSVEVYLRIAGTVHRIRRFGPPMRLTIDGKTATQEQVEQLIGMSRLRFLHSIIFGQGEKMFPDLTGPDRGELFDEVLDLAIWSDAADKAVKKHSAFDKELSNKRVSLSFIEGKLASLQTPEQVQTMADEWEKQQQSLISQLREASANWDKQQANKVAQATVSANKWEDEKRIEIEEIAAKLEALEADRSLIQVRVDELAEQTTDKVLTSAVFALEQQVEALQQKQFALDSSLKRTEGRLYFWNQNDVCPECNQPITPGQKALQLTQITTERDTLLDEPDYKAMTDELKRTIAAERVRERQEAVKLAALREEYRGACKEAFKIGSEIETTERVAQRVLQELDNNTNPFVTQLTNLANEVDPYKHQIDIQIAKVNPHLSRLTELTNERTDLEANLQEAKDAYQKTQGLLLAAEYWKQGFKKIRLFFVQKILQALEIEIQSALSSLGLANWKIKLSTEAETKSGTVKLGICIQVCSPKGVWANWDAWSGGESQRLRLGMGMGLASLIQRAAGIKYLFEVWDEPTNWLGAEGIEDLLESLNYRAISQQKQAWIIDHRALTYSGFREIWSVCKDIEGSTIKLLTQAEV